MDTIFGIKANRDGRLGRSVASLVECSCTPAAEDAYIQLSAGYIKVGAYLCSAELTARLNAGGFMSTVKIHSGVEGQNTPLWPDCVPVVFAPLAMAVDDLFFSILLGRTDTFGVYLRLDYIRHSLTPETVLIEAQRLVCTIISQINPSRI